MVRGSMSCPYDEAGPCEARVEDTGVPERGAVNASEDVWAAGVLAPGGTMCGEGIQTDQRRDAVCQSRLMRRPEKDHP